MSVPVFIGDEVSAAAYRLSGMSVHITDGSDVMLLIRQACERAPLVLVGSSVVRNIHSDELDGVLATIQPPVLVVPDVRGLHEVPDTVARIHRQLGMLE